MKQIRKRITYANVMSSIAVFLVLGGAAFAASQLPKNSVGTKQLKKNAVTTAKIKNGAVTSTKVNVTGFPKVPSATTADSATNAGHATNADKATTATKADSATSAANATGLAGPLASGQSLFGRLALAGHKNEALDFVAESSISFPIPLAAAPTVNVITPGGGPTANCPGTSAAPAAASGNLCIFETGNTGFTGLSVGVTRFGASVFPSGVSAASNYELQSVWVVTG
ncbi:MAG TPA: hypothetical protein VFP21_13205 [Solirubrobacterales bacterium]|nr:hypothetical protein [Solirubrobacterales bacterium]